MFKQMVTRRVNPRRVNLVLTTDDTYPYSVMCDYRGLGFSYYPHRSWFHRGTELYNTATYELSDLMVSRLALKVADDGVVGDMARDVFAVPWTSEARRVYDEGRDIIHTIKCIKEMDMVIITAIIRDFGLELSDPYLCMLKDHQLQALALYIVLGYADNWGQMRTGKTPPTIIYNYALILRQEVDSCLVVCPNSIKHIWYKELAHFLPPIVQKLSVIIEGTKKKKRELWNKSALFKIVNYETLRADFEIVQEVYSNRRWALVLDESHNIKNPSKQTRAVQSLCYGNNPPKSLVCLSGTPVANKPQDIIRPLLLTAPDLVGKTYRDFADTFCRIGGYSGNDIVGYRKGALEELHSRMARCSVRAMRADVNMELGKVYEPQELGMSSLQRKTHNDLLTLLRAELYNDKGEWTSVKVNSFLARLMKLQQVTAGFLIDRAGNPFWMADRDNSKLKWLDSFIEAYMPYEVDKLVIACKFRAVIQRLVQRYAKLGAVCIYGDVKGAARVDAMERFQSHPDCHIIIVNAITAEGLDLNPAQFMVFYTKDFQLKVNQQMEDRITGFRQRGESTIMPLVCSSSIDSNLEEVLEKKQKWQDAVMGVGKVPSAFEGGLAITKEDLFFLVKG